MSSQDLYFKGFSQPGFLPKRHVPSPECLFFSFFVSKKNNRHLASQENKLSHFIQVIRKNLTQQKLSGILANTKNIVELGSFQGIGFQTYLIVFISLVMSDLLVFVSFCDVLKKNVMYLSLIPSFGTRVESAGGYHPVPTHLVSLLSTKTRFLFFQSTYRINF